MFTEQELHKITILFIFIYIINIYFLVNSHTLVKYYCTVINNQILILNTYKPPEAPEAPEEKDKEIYYYFYTP
jgi:hypothetical protein